MKKILQIIFLCVFLTSISYACDTSNCSVAILPTTNQVVAIANGNWNSPAIWDTGVVPGANKNVVIPSGISVNYNLNSNVNGTPVRSVLINGTLSFATSVNTSLVVNTIVVSSTGTLNIGTQTTPINAIKTAKITFNGTAIDTSVDPQLKGIGLLSHGTVNIFGAQKTAYIAVDGTGNVTGDTIALKEIPSGWNVGDTVLITGSEYTDVPVQSTQVLSSEYNTHDEVRTISAISGNVITLNSPLNELLPNGTPKKHERIHPGMEIYTANLTRNVQFSTAANVSTIYKRGHTMFMTSPNISINNAAFIDLGRSDKSYPLTAKFANGVVPGSNPTITTTGSLTQFDSNMRGRYPVHMHKIGATQANPITFTNNVILRSPGWGFSLHSSYANVTNNVSFDIMASHFVSEDGDERGVFFQNLAVKSIGDTVDDFQIQKVGQPATTNSRKGSKGYSSYDQTVDANGNIIEITPIQDDGQVGNCYWFQSRNLAVVNNIANSCSRVGIMFFHRHVNSADTPYSYLLSPFKDLMAWHQKLSNTQPILFDSNKIPLTTVLDNISIGTRSAFSVIKANNNQNHNIYNHVSGIRGFNMGSGCIEFGYTGKYFVEDIECYATPNSTSDFDVGIDTNNSVEYMVFKDFKINGWNIPFDTQDFFNGLPNVSAITFINGQVKLKNSTTYIPFDPSAHLYLFNQYPRVSGSGYKADIHKVVDYNQDMDVGSSLYPVLTNVNMPVLNVNGTTNPGWWNLEYKITATITDSAGVHQSSSPQSSYTVNSWESKWPGQAIRMRWLEQVNGVYVNRQLNPDGSTCLKIIDHAMDRVNGNLITLNFCIPIIGN